MLAFRHELPLIPPAEPGGNIFLTERTWLSFVGQGIERVILALSIEGSQVIVQSAQTSFEARIIAREAVQVRDDGVVGTSADGIVFEAIEAEESQVLDGDAIHEKIFVGSAGVVFLLQSRAESLQDTALTGAQVSQEEFVGGASTVLQGIQPGLGFAFGSFWHRMVER